MVKTRLTAEEFFALPLERGSLWTGRSGRRGRPSRSTEGSLCGSVTT